MPEGRGFRHRLRLVNLFGSWTAALRAAGIEPGTRHRRFSGGAETARKAAIEKLRQLAQELGRAPTRADWRGPVSFQTVCRLFGGWLAALEAAGIKPGPRQRKRPAGSSEQRRIAIVERLRSLAEKLGRTPRMADWNGPFDVGAVLRCFGTWNAAVEAAGLKPNRPTFRRVRPKISDEEILDALRRLAAELGRRPTYGDLLTPAAAELECPCPATVCRRELRKKGVPVLRLGGWSSQPLRTVLEWLRGVPARGVLPSREEIRAAMGDRAFAFLERWVAGATLREIGDPEGFTRERVRQIMARGAQRAVLQLASRGRERKAPESLVPRDKVRLALRALRKTTVVRDLVSLAAAIAELENAVRELKGAVDCLQLHAGR